MAGKQWSDPAHPMWGPINVAVTGLIVFICLRTTATNFDASEWKAIGGIVTGAGGWKLIEYFITHWKGGDRGNNT